MSIHEAALVRDVSRRLAIAGHAEVRVIDRVLLVLELDRAEALPRVGPHLDLEIRAVAVSIRAEQAEVDRDRAELREAAAREMAGDVA